MLRAIGPTLTSVGIVNPLLDPTIEIDDGNGAVIGFNDDWKGGQTQPLFATQLNPTNDHEAAIVAFLAPGNYIIDIGLHCSYVGKKACFTMLLGYQIMRRSNGPL